MSIVRGPKGFDLGFLNFEMRLKIAQFLDSSGLNLALLSFRMPGRQQITRPERQPPRRAQSCPGAGPETQGTGKHGLHESIQSLATYEQLS